MEETASPQSDEKVTAWARLLRVSQGLLGKVEDDLKVAGFPPLSWYDVLLELRRAAPNGLRPFQLQEQILLTQYNLSRLLDRLENAGYVTRLPCPEDGRGQVVQLSKQGEDLLQSMWPAYQQAIQTHFAEKLDDQETATLAQILMKLR